MKKNIKKIKPEFIVDATNAETASDLLNAITEAKIKAGKKVTEYELSTLIHSAIMDCLYNLYKLGVIDMVGGVVFPHFEVIVAEVEKKHTPWYKKLWNKLKYAFTW